MSEASNIVKILVVSGEFGLTLLPFALQVLWTYLLCHPVNIKNILGQHG